MGPVRSAHEPHTTPECISWFAGRSVRSGFLGEAEDHFADDVALICDVPASIVPARALRDVLTHEAVEFGGAASPVWNGDDG
jgi:hypothetical protein